MKVCPSCKTKYDDKYRFCKQCGNALLPIKNNALNINLILVVSLVIITALSIVGYFYFNGKSLGFKAKSNSRSETYMSPFFGKDKNISIDGQLKTSLGKNYKTSNDGKSSVVNNYSDTQVYLNRNDSSLEVQETSEQAFIIGLMYVFVVPLTALLLDILIRVRKCQY